MLFFYLAMSGGAVVIPDGETVVDKEGEPEVQVLDASGRVLAIFQRSDVSMYSRTLLQVPTDIAQA